MASITDNGRTTGVPASVEESVEKAGLLLAYAASRGLPIEESLIRSLVSAKASLANGDRTLAPDSETQFWCALRDVAKKIEPASLESIEARSDAHGERVLTFSGYERMSCARAAVRRYQLTSVIALFVLLTVQLYAGTGGKILNGLEDVEHTIVEKRQAMSTLNNELLIAGIDDARRQEIRNKQSDVKDDLEFLEKDLRARYRLLDIWNPFRSLSASDPAIAPAGPANLGQAAAGPEAVRFDTGRAAVPTTFPTEPRPEPAVPTGDPPAPRPESGDAPSAEATPETARREPATPAANGDELSALLSRSVTPQPREAPTPVAATLASAASNTEDQFRQHIVLAGRITLESLNLYFLPLVYGLLGACAYVLRRLSTEVREYTYSPESEIRLKLRMYLGALSGFAVAWFINQATTPGLAETITPMALAFLAGYSVEVVFSGMDNLINAFSRDANKGSKQ